MKKFVAFAAVALVPLMGCGIPSLTARPVANTPAPAPVVSYPTVPAPVLSTDISDLPPAYEQPDFDVVPGGGRGGDELTEIIITDGLQCLPGWVVVDNDCEEI